MKYLVKFRLLIVGIFSSLVLLTNTSQATIISPGTMCQPANLQQALALGLGWSQFGLTNNSPLGGGSFFVACPIVIDEDELDDDFVELSMEFQYLNPSSMDIICTLYTTWTLFGFTNAVNLPVPINNYTALNEGRFSIQSNIFNSFPGERMYNVICAMHPQSRLGQIKVSSDGFY